MKCKDCKKYITSGTPGHGFCSFPNSYMPTQTKNDCFFIDENHKTVCGDCSHFGEDFACIGMSEDDEFARKCGGFIHKSEELIIEAVEKLMYDCKYSRADIEQLLDELEDKYKELIKF